MSRLGRKLKQLHRRNSKQHALLMLAALLIVLGISTVARFYIVEPIKIMDNSMSPKIKERSTIWMCKLPSCLKNFDDQDIVWAKLESGETMVRSVIAMPGDTVKISDQGKVSTSHRNFKWRGENAFIQTRTIHIPKKGDTLVFDQLNDVEQDYAISYLKSKGANFKVKTTLWQGDRELPIERVGSTKIGNRQVSLNEIDFLPWQDRYLIEMQIRLSEPGNAPIKLRRELYYESTAIKDSVETKTLTPIDSVAIVDDCYYLICKKSSNCTDSKEIGFFTKKNIIGTHIVFMDKIKETAWNPLEYRVKRILNFIKLGFSVAHQTASKSYNKVWDLLPSKEALPDSTDISR